MSRLLDQCALDPRGRQGGVAEFQYAHQQQQRAAASVEIVAVVKDQLPWHFTSEESEQEQKGMGGLTIGLEIVYTCSPEMTAETAARASALIPIS